MKSWIDEKGRFCHLINIFDALAVTILIILLLIGWRSWLNYQNYLQEKNRTRQQLQLEKEQQQLQYLREKEDYFLFESVKTQNLSLIKQGLSITDHRGNRICEILEISASYPCKKFLNLDTQSQWIIYQSDSSLTTLLLKIRYQVYEYAGDSVFFLEQRLIPEGHFIFPFPGVDLQGIIITYEPSWYEIQPVYCLPNIPLSVARSYIKPGTVLYNAFNQKIAEFKEILSTQPYHFTDRINGLMADIQSPNCTICARLILRLHKINNRYYLDYQPFTNQLQGYIRIDSNQWIAVKFEFSEPQNLNSKPGTLSSRMVIHQLTPQETGNLRENQAIFNNLGKQIGTIREILSQPFNDFYYNPTYNTRNSFVQYPQSDCRRITVNAEFAADYNAGYFYLENIPLYPSSMNMVTISMLINTNYLTRKAEIIFPITSSIRSESIAIQLNTQEKFTLPALLLDVASGSGVIGRICEKKKDIYIAVIELEQKLNGMCYYNDRGINYFNESNYLIYTPGKLINTTGSFLPHHEAVIEIMIDTMQLKNPEAVLDQTEPGLSETSLMAYQTVAGKYRVQCRARLYRINSIWYLLYPETPIIPGQRSSIRTKGRSLDGIIISINQSPD